MQDADLHYLALRALRGTAVDYADAVNAESGARAGCLETVTFDRRAAAGGQMRLLTG